MLRSNRVSVHFYIKKSKSNRINWLQFTCAPSSQIFVNFFNTNLGHFTTIMSSFTTPWYRKVPLLKFDRFNLHIGKMSIRLFFQDRLEESRFNTRKPVIVWAYYCNNCGRNLSSRHNCNWPNMAGHVSRTLFLVGKEIRNLI